MKEKETGFLDEPVRDLDTNGSLHSGHHRGHRWAFVILAGSTWATPHHAWSYRHERGQPLLLFPRRPPIRPRRRLRVVHTEGQNAGP